MALMLAPYNEAMRLGMGFNSYTQQLCVNDVVRKTGGLKVSESDLHAIAPQPTSQNAVSNSTENAAILSQPTGTSFIQHRDGQASVSQVVSWEAGFVDKVSEITDSLNISGQLAITVDALGGGAGGGGNYLNSTALTKSDATYKVTVKVTNQKLIADDMSEFSPIPNVPASMFNEVYGDTFISGFIEGGVFNAVVMKELENTTKKKKMGGNLSVKLKLTGVGEVEGKAEGAKIDDNTENRHSTTINVSWSGGGDIKPDYVKEWDIPSLVKVAMEFPDCVAACPQRTYAILTKYSSLRSFREQAVKGSPLDYENAGIYTATLLDAYMDYKTMWKDIQQMSSDVEHDLARIETRPSNQNLVVYGKNFNEDYNKRVEKFHNAEKALVATARGQAQVTLEEPLPPNLVEPYVADIFGLEKAKADCRFEMIKIVREANDVALNPKVSTDPFRLWRYLSPNIFRLLLPTSKQTEKPKTPEEIEELKNQMEAAIQREATSNTEAQKLKVENEGLKQQLSDESQQRKQESSLKEGREAQAGATAEDEIRAENERLKQQLSDESQQRKQAESSLKEECEVKARVIAEEKTRAEKAEKSLEKERVQKADADRKVTELEKGVLLWGARTERWRTGRIQIYFILYGGEFIWDDNIARRMIRFCETNEDLVFNDSLFGRDPWQNVRKGGAILYRYDNTGEMRCLVRKQDESARFDPLP